MYSFIIFSLFEIYWNCSLHSRIISNDRPPQQSTLAWKSVMKKCQLWSVALLTFTVVKIVTKRYQSNTIIVNSDRM